MIKEGYQLHPVQPNQTGASLNAGEEPIVFETLSSSGPGELSPPVRPPAVPSSSSVPQGWLKKFGQSIQTPSADSLQAQPASPRIVVILEEAESKPFLQQVREWFWGPNGFSVGVTCLLHALMLSAMGYVVLDQQREEPLLELFSFRDEEIATDDFIEVGELGEVFNEGGEPSKEIAEMVMPELNDPDLLIAANPGEVDLLGGLQALNGVGQGNGEGPGVDVTAIPGRNAVAKGSFTAWTKPEDPLPREDYVLFLRIKVGDQVKKLPLTDLAGSTVTGTDGFRLRIPLDLKYVTFVADNGNVMSHEPYGQTSQLLDKTVDVQEGYVTLRVIIPGAENLVKDTIQVHSRMLKEKQTLEIEF